MRSAFRGLGQFLVLATNQQLTTPKQTNNPKAPQNKAETFHPRTNQFALFVCFAKIRMKTRPKGVGSILTLQEAKAIMLEAVATKLEAIAISNKETQKKR